MIIISLLSIFNIISYYSSGYPHRGLTGNANCFGFWNYVLHYNAGSALMFISPFIISFLVLNGSYNKLSGSYFKNALLRNNYKKEIKKELHMAYLKAWLPFLINSLVVFAIGYIYLEHNIVFTEYSNQYFEFDYAKTMNPYMFVFLYNISLFLYTTMIVNISYIVFRILKKLSISIIGTFIFLNALNFILGDLTTIICNIYKSEALEQYFHYFNVYDSYIITSNIYEGIINTSAIVVLTYIIMIFLYKNKERLVLAFE